MNPAKQRKKGMAGLSNKYNAKKCVVNGKTCDSKLEGRYYERLVLAEKSGYIRDLKFHPRYNLHANGVKIGVCELDFVYYDLDKGKHIYVDVKGVYTAFSRWKHKHFEIEYNAKVEIWK